MSTPLRNASHCGNSSREGDKPFSQSVTYSVGHCIAVKNEYTALSRGSGRSSLNTALSISHRDGTLITQAQLPKILQIK